MKLTITHSPLILCFLLLLTGCATGYAPVSDLSSASTSSSSSKSKKALTKKYSIANLPKTYKVKSGDTLYSIAWKYGLDFKRLAKMNKINKSFTIYTNQILFIKQAAIGTKSSAIKNSSLNGKSKMSAKTDTSINIKTQKKKDNRKNTTKTAKTNSSKSQRKTATKPSRQSVGKILWKWPAKGKVVNKFSSENKGLNISGTKGEAVYAAASGTVVYAGNGIIGYGNLIIIKHSEEYLSAYAHNSVILVEENNRIKGGQKVAEIGSSGTIKTILHFEIRKDGKPVNPLKYLPRK